MQVLNLRRTTLGKGASMSTFNTRLSCFTALLLASGMVFADVVYDETADGDLSSDQNSPTHIGTLNENTNTIVAGVTQGSDWSDNFTFTVPAGSVLSAFVITDMNSSGGYLPISLYRGTGFDGESIEFINLLGSAVPLDLLQFDSAPGPQQAGTFFVKVGIQNTTSATYAIDVIVTQTVSLGVNGNADVYGDLAVGGSIHNQMAPIAIGFINADGSISSSSGNIASTWTGSRYEIAIDGYSYWYDEFVTVVSTVEPNRTMNTSSSSGNLLVYCRDDSGAAVQCRFQFVSYHPNPPQGAASIDAKFHEVSGSDDALVE